MSETLEQRTRVNYGTSRKISDGNYGSYDFHCSISVDVKEGEEVKDVVGKCIQFTEAVVKSKVEQGQKGKLPY